MPVIYTIGHSNVSQAELINALLAARIELLVDVRRYPASRRNPWFNRDALAAGLGEHGVEYRHSPELGGRRQPRPDSPNAALKNEAFRGYADYMQTPEFEAAIEDLIAQAARTRTAIMCAEALPWRCHRSLIADALTARSLEVEHLLGVASRRHTLRPEARVEDGRVRYPALL
jgi:uncharacterized protein (DUF488 family)